MNLCRNTKNFLYNLDRALASLFGAGPQETISSESGRHKWLHPLAWILDKIQAKHVEIAEEHADKLDAVDDKNEQ